MPAAYGQGAKMEGSGTDLDLTRDYIKRVDRIDADVHDLKRGQGKMAEAVAAQGAQLSTLVNVVSNIDEKLDQTRTQKTPVWVIGGGLAALFSAMMAYQTFIFAPYQLQVQQNEMRIRGIEGSRYTKNDARHDLEKLEEEVDDELYDLRQSQRRQDDRLLELERKKADK